ERPGRIESMVNATNDVMIAINATNSINEDFLGLLAI
ncbi:MAG: hypothetical protein ACI86P_002581, partial [Flavobacteriales bacterium]